MAVYVSMINKVYSVSELISHLSSLLESDPLLSDVWITGEVANASTSASGHTYFSLRDGNVSFRCVLFSRYTGSEFVSNGSQVNVHGRITIYPARGEIQLTSDIVQPVGIGLLAAEFELLREKLSSEGLFEVTRKRSLPELPKLIGLVTSEFGSVYHDISETLNRRYPVAQLLLCGVQVQGDNAESEISEAIKQLNKVDGLDAIIIARGGGSLEDLHAFNSELVARAIHASKIPVVSGVGHETDVTIADWVADVRAPTPTAAAELVSPSKEALNFEITTTLSRSQGILFEKVISSKTAISSLISSMIHSMPNTNNLRQSVDIHLSSARQSVNTISSNYKIQIAQQISALTALNPDAVLKRGYSVIELESGVRVKSVSALRSGINVKATLPDGHFSAIVNSAEFTNNKGSMKEVDLLKNKSRIPTQDEEVVKNDRSNPRKPGQRKLF
ncbi:MAG: exodeoxyribonuclease VII large subunit [Chloroflexi bacterium]|nr:exodeoxyribonuclease VII large subunit [Chloroflexota bacterium]